MPSQPRSPDRLTFAINRAPVLTLWAAVVAERLGFDAKEALTLGKAVAGLNAQSKGQRLGIYHPSEKLPTPAARRKTGEQFQVDLLGRSVPVEQTKDGIRAAIRGQVIHPAGVERYLQGKFKDHLEPTRQAMQTLASKYPPDDLAAHAFALYEQFRPDIPAGVKGWGAAGTLDVRRLASLGH